MELFLWRSWSEANPNSEWFLRWLHSRESWRSSEFIAHRSGGGGAWEAVRLRASSRRNPPALSTALSSLDLVRKSSQKPRTAACTWSPSRSKPAVPRVLRSVFTEEPKGARRKGCRITGELGDTCRFSVKIKLRFHIPATMGAFNSEKAN